MVIVYTGTENLKRRNRYRDGKIFSSVEKFRQSDVGDLGAGVYTDKNKYRASLYGKYVFMLDLDDDLLLKVKSVYDPETIACKWLVPYFFDEKERMKTISSRYTVEEKIKFANEIRKVCLRRGYHGIIDDSGEVVLFSNKPIKTFKEVTKQNILKFDALSKGDRVYVSNPELKSYSQEGIIKVLQLDNALVELGKRKRWLSVMNIDKKKMRYI